MTEAQHQANVIRWSQQPTIRARFPELKYLAHVKNEARDARDVAIAAGMGVKKGFPDLILPVPRGGYGCLLIEMKTEKGRTSEAQRWWIDHMNAEGNYAVVCHGWEEAVKVITDYLEERINNG